MSCKYCDKNTAEYFGRNKGFIILNGVDLCYNIEWDEDEAEINYCPMCGERLGEE